VAFGDARRHATPVYEEYLRAMNDEREGDDVADNALPNPDFRCGFVALAGRPNVGKSTLLNALIGFRLSIVSPRPQTTRHRILGIATSDAGQILYVDTPGLHRGAKRAMNRSLNRAVRSAISEVELALQVIEAGRWTDEDEALYEVLAEQKIPRLLVINKVDLSKDKATLLPFVADLSEKHSFEAVHYISALKRKGLEALTRDLLARLPVRAPVFGEDEITDRSERFLAAEMVREQLMLRLDQELPYATTVEIEQFTDRPDGIAEIHAVIWVERDGQKAIVIGQGGEQLKAIGTAARRHMERMFDRKVFLRLWVKVREGWVDDEGMLKQFGYTD
jgi:GTP-binding protein Era